MTLPERVDAANASQLGDMTTLVLAECPAELIADLTATVSCDHAGADAIMDCYQRATVHGADLRLVVPDRSVRRVLAHRRLDRLVPIYPALAAAVAAGEASAAPGGQDQASAPGAAQASARPDDDPGLGVVTPALLWRIIDALHDGVALVGEDGTVVLANRRAAEIFGYSPGEMTGASVDALVPAQLRQVHRAYRAGYARRPRTRLMGDPMRLVGQSKDGASVPLRISLTPVPTATAVYTMAVIRDAARERHADLADLARAVIEKQAHHGQELLDRMVAGVFRIGLSLEGAVEMSGDVAIERIAGALQHLDDTILDIRAHVFAARHGGPPPSPPDASPGDR